MKNNLCWGLFLIKLQTWRLQQSRFSVNIAKFLRTAFFQRTKNLRKAATDFSMALIPSVRSSNWSMLILINIQGSLYSCCCCCCCFFLLILFIKEKVISVKVSACGVNFLFLSVSLWQIEHVCFCDVSMIPMLLWCFPIFPQREIYVQIIPISVLRKRCFENMQQIYFGMGVLNLLHIFRTP